MGSFSKLAVIVGFVNLSSALPQAGGSIAYSASGFSHGDGANYISADDHSVNKTEPFVPRSDGGPVSSSTDPTNPVPPGQLDADPDAAQTTSNATSSYTISNVVINRSKSDTDVSSPLIPLIEYFDLMISTNASTNDNSNAAPSAHCNLTWTPVMDVMPYMTCDDRVGVSPHFNAQLQQDTPSALAGFTLSVSTGPLGSSPPAVWTTKDLTSDPSWVIAGNDFVNPGPITIMSPGANSTTRPSSTPTPGDR